MIEIISQCSDQDPKFRAQVVMGYSALALETSRQAPIARILLGCAQKIVGGSTGFGAQSFWTDAALLNGAGIASVLFGPGGAGLHSAVEYVNLEDVALCAETLVQCAQGFCA